MKLPLATSGRRLLRVAVAAVSASTLALVIASSAMATGPSTVYVRSDGSNPNCDGTANVAYPGSGSGLACAKATPQAASDIVAADGSVYMTTGLFPGFSVVTDGVKFYGAQHGVDARTRASNSILLETTISGASPVALLGNDDTLDGFTVQDSDSSDKIAGIYTHPGFVGGLLGGAQILNNIVQNNVQGISINNTTHPALVQFNLIRNNNNAGPNGGSGLTSDFGLANTTIDNNKFEGNTNFSILLESDSAPNNTISNNTGDSPFALANLTSSTMPGNVVTGAGGNGGINFYGGNNGVAVTGGAVQNGLIGIRVKGTGNSNITVHGTKLTGNSQAGMQVDAGAYSGTLNATQNYWTGTPTFSLGTGGGHSVEGAGAGQVSVGPWYTDAGLTTLSTQDTVYADPGFSLTSAGGHVFGYDAFTTIQAGVDAAATSGTVHVAVANYPEAVTVNKTLAILGAQTGTPGNSHSGAESAVIGFTVTADNVVIRGFHMTPGTDNSGVGVRIQGNSPTVRDSVITGYDGSGVFWATGSGTPNIRDNRFANATGTTTDGIQVQSGVTSSTNANYAGNVYDHASTGGGADMMLGPTAQTGTTVTDSPSTGGVTWVALFNSTNGSLSNSTFAGDQSYSGSIAYIGGGNHNTTIDGVDFSGSSGGAVAVANIFGYGPNSGTTITNSYLHGSVRGISVGAGAVAAGETVVANNNKITDNTLGARNLSDGSLDATRNHWGTANATAVAALMAGSNVTYLPYYVDSGKTVLSNNANLASLSLSGLALSPAFDPVSFIYTASPSVANSVTSVTVNKTANLGATAEVSGDSGLAVGPNDVKVKVTSADGTSKTYTVTVTREAPASIPPPVICSTGYVLDPVTGQCVLAPVTPPVTSTVPNVAVAVPVPPNQAGNTSIVVAPTTNAPGETTPAPPVTVDFTWAADTFAPSAGGTAPPVKVEITPKPEFSVPAGGGTTPTPIAGGFTAGGVVFQLTVTNTNTDAAITNFAAPMSFCFSAMAADQVPAYSHDGVSWTTIPLLPSPELPANQQDGYFVNADGSGCIYTRHATLFGLLHDAQAPSKPVVKATLVGKKLYLTIRAKDNVRLAGFRLVFGRQVKTTPKSYLVLPVHAGRVQVTATDKAGNRSKPSLPFTVIGDGTKKHPYKIKKG